MHMTNAKRIITVRVGTPVLRKYSNSTDYYVHIQDYERIKVRCNLDYLINELQQLKVQYGNEYANLQIDGDRDCGCQYHCDCNPSYYLQGDRLETDLEYDLRIQQEAARAAAIAERERAEYEKLKAKFGDKA
jgi:hypothetical protein